LLSSEQEVEDLKYGLALQCAVVVVERNRVMMLFGENRLALDVPNHYAPSPVCS
jgi:hypothetical protein